MALWQPITQENGFDASYWRIVDVRLNWNGKFASITIVGYKNRDVRLNSPKSGIMARKNVEILNDQFEEYFGAFGVSTDGDLEQTDFDREMGYQIVKQKLSDFSSAEDYLEVEAKFEHTITDLSVDFTDKSTSRDGSPVKWVWDFGDGNTTTIDENDDGYSTGDENVNHTYGSQGAYSVQLTTTDTEGYVHSVTKEITV